MTEKFKDLKRGDLVELVLTDNAKLYNDDMTAVDFFSTEDGVNQPGRHFVGYVIGDEDRNEESYISLISGWNMETNGHPEPFRLQGLIFYAKAVLSYSKK